MSVEKELALVTQLVHQHDADQTRIVELTTALENTTANCNELAQQLVESNGHRIDQNTTLHDLRIELDRLNGVKRELDTIVAALRKDLDGSTHALTALQIEKRGAGEGLTRIIASVAGEWFARHDLTQPVNPGCVCDLLDELVNRLPINVKDYTELFNAVADGAREQQAEPGSPKDEVDALIERIVASNPGLNIKVVRLTKE